MFNILSWNINGLRAKMKNDSGFNDYLLNPLIKKKYDVLCFQEQKCNVELLLNDDGLLPKFEEYKHIAYTSENDKKGYAGVMILSKSKFDILQIGLGKDIHDKNGRLITVKFEQEKIILFAVYVPNSGENLKNLEYRKQWNIDFYEHINSISLKYSNYKIIITGDLNAAVNDIDVYDAKKMRNKMAGFHDIERDFIKKLLDNDFIDVYMDSVTNKKEVITNQHYTFWSNLGKMRQKKKGWRIDYFLVKNCKYKKFENLQHVESSDHCPISLSVVK